MHHCCCGIVVVSVWEGMVRQQRAGWWRGQGGSDAEILPCAGEGRWQHVGETWACRGGKGKASGQLLLKHTGPGCPRGCWHHGTWETVVAPGCAPWPHTGCTGWGLSSFTLWQKTWDKWCSKNKAQILPYFITSEESGFLLKVEKKLL